MKLWKEIALGPGYYLCYSHACSSIKWHTEAKQEHEIYDDALLFSTRANGAN